MDFQSVVQDRRSSWISVFAPVKGSSARSGKLQVAAKSCIFLGIWMACKDRAKLPLTVGCLDRSGTRSGQLGICPAWRTAGVLICNRAATGLGQGTELRQADLVFQLHWGNASVQRGC